ncbi:MAG: bifunctional diaminohydroxyphosphoribosylaminopyrimidine deaminase/5-amino-6-(5-phosphoribosylamino)uracil reductase RibD [Bacteroidetes bacterium]|nr:bifunctional diaminohydroxyphosphoribosylaminopyrimidine deaminase/5-amino-6-(5-phosphoribosylamino)uracil reductase RibD [Bacteroidota bacterium]
MTRDNIFIQRCIYLAGKGKGLLETNPMVGCVIVYNDKIIAEGYHKEYGGPHAEVNAINKLKDKEILKHSILYVNLEPCSHVGKTPPCADLIISMKIPKVIIGNIDPNNLVAGRGIKKLKSAGVEVVSGILNNECKELNKRFFTFHNLKRPYIILKWAQSLDGFIGNKKDSYKDSKPVWITNENLRTLVHKWRAEEQSIMIGTNTALLDNPQLNTRNWTGKNPIRIVCDRLLRLPENLYVFDGKISTIILTAKNIKNKNSKNLEYINIDFENNFVKQVCDILFEKNIQSLFVEGGAKLHQTFINSNKWDEARVFTGNINLYQGVQAPIIKGNIVSEGLFNNDRLTIYKNI